MPADRTHAEPATAPKAKPRRYKPQKRATEIQRWVGEAVAQVDPTRRSLWDQKALVLMKGGSSDTKKTMAAIKEAIHAAALANGADDSKDEAFNWAQAFCRQMDNNFKDKAKGLRLRQTWTMNEEIILAKYFERTDPPSLKKLAHVFHPRPPAQIKARWALGPVPLMVDEEDMSPSSDGSAVTLSDSDLDVTDDDIETESGTDTPAPSEFSSEGGWASGGEDDGEEDVGGWDEGALDDAMSGQHETGARSAHETASPPPFDSIGASGRDSPIHHQGRRTIRAAAAHTSPVATTSNDGENGSEEEEGEDGDASDGGTDRQSTDDGRGSCDAWVLEDSEGEDGDEEYEDDGTESSDSDSW